MKSYISRKLPLETRTTAMTFDFDRSRGYFENTAQVRLPDIFPPFLANEVPRHHGVVACEGSMFKSKFANALTTMMIGSLGMAAAQNKLSVGYGGEAGDMDPLLAKMCARYCRNSLIITRNEESRTRLRELGVPTELGTDTASVFEVSTPNWAALATVVGSLNYIHAIGVDAIARHREPLLRRLQEQLPNHLDEIRLTHIGSLELTSLIQVLEDLR